MRSNSDEVYAFLSHKVERGADPTESTGDSGGSTQGDSGKEMSIIIKKIIITSISLAKFNVNPPSCAVVLWLGD